MFSTKTTLSIKSIDFFSTLRSEGAEKVVAQLKEHVLKYGLPQEIFHYGNVYSPIDWFFTLEEQAVNVFLELRKQIPGFLPEPKDLFPLGGDVLGLGNTHVPIKWIKVLKDSAGGDEVKEGEVKAYIRDAIQASLDQLDKLKTSTEKERAVANAMDLASRAGWDEIKSWMLSLPVVKSVINECKNQRMLDLFFRGNGRSFSGYDFLLSIQAFMEGGYEKALERVVRDDSGEISKTFIANGFNVFGKDFVEAARKSQSLGIKNIAKAIEQEVLLEGSNFCWSTLPSKEDAAKALMECGVPVINPSRMSKEEVERFEGRFTYVAAEFESGAVEEYLKHPAFKAAIQKNLDFFMKRAFAVRPRVGIDENLAAKIKIAKRLGATLQGKDWEGFKLLDPADLVTPGSGREASLKKSIEMVRDLGIDIVKDTDLLENIRWFKGEEGKRALKRLKSHGVIQFDGGVIAKVLSRDISSTVLKMFALDAGDAVNDLDFQGRPVWWSTHPSNTDVWWKNLSDEGIGAKSKSGEPLAFFLLSNPYRVSSMNEFEISKRMKMLVQKVDKDVYDFGMGYRDEEGKNIMHLFLRTRNSGSSYAYADMFRLWQNEMGLNDVLLKELLNQKNNEGRTPIESLFDSCKKSSYLTADHLPFKLIEGFLPMVEFEQLSDKDRFISEVGDFISKIKDERVRMSLERELLLMATPPSPKPQATRSPARKI